MRIFVGIATLLLTSRLTSSTPEDGFKDELEFGTSVNYAAMQLIGRPRASIW